MQQLFPFCNQFADWIAQRGKFCFIFGHDIPLVHYRVPMQVEGMAIHHEEGAFKNFCHGEIKERAVIRLEFDGAAVR